jgi:uncharacterized membrane protein
MPEARPRPDQEHSWSDLRMEQIIGNLLRTGVVLAAMVVLSGGAIFLFRHGSSPADYRTFRGEPENLRSIGGIFRQAFGGRGRGIIQLGLLLLIATPVARVAFAVWGFALERDRMYVVFTLIVLAVLLYSLFGSQWVF